MADYAIFPLLAFVAMFFQDLLSVWLVRAEASGRARAAGFWDLAQDVFNITGRVTGFGVVLLSHNILLSVLTIGATLVADYLGTSTGVRVSVHLDNKREADSVGSRSHP